MFNRYEVSKCIGSVVISLALVFGAQGLRSLEPPHELAAETGAASAASENGIVYLHVDAPTPAGEDGVVSADEWRETYPAIVASMEANEDNSYRISYIEEDPYITNLYEGYGFAKDYTSAIGHTYCLEDVHNTERPHALANCLTCKTPNFTKLVNDLGEEVYQYDFEETWAQMRENTSCYNCHENQAGDAGKLVVTHSYMVKALGDTINEINPAVMSCGQCHIEYYFDPDTKATSSPVSDLETMHPAKMLEYYNKMGFSDWVQESTGTGMLKTQHPEFETFLQGVHAKMPDPTDPSSTVDCATCHMPIETAEDGTVYHSHKWVSPLESDVLLETCASCHGETDMAEKVHAIQEEITGREREVGEKLSALKDALAQAVADGAMGEDQLNEVRQLYRDAQWFWDFSYVENSEGAHNSALDRECLDTAENKADEAMSKLSA